MWPEWREVTSPFKILTRKPTGMGPLGRYSNRWEDNAIMDLKEISINTRNLVDSVMDRVYLGVFVIAALNLRLT